MYEQTSRVLKAVLIYSFFSATMPIVNKLAVAGLGLPSAVTSIQLVFSALVCVALRKARLAPVDALVWSKVKPYLIYVLLFTICLYSSIRAVANANIETIIVFRSTAPIFVAALEWAFLGRALPSARSGGALLLITLGSFLYVRTDAQFGALGFGAYGWASIYLFFIGIQMAYGKVILNDVHMETMWGPVYYTNLLGIIPSIALGVTQGEFSDPATLAHFAHGLGDAKLISSLFLSMLIGVGISWAGFNCRSLLSATSYTVVGVMNKVITVLIGQVAFESHAAWQGIGALMICVLGGTIYRQAPKRAEGVGVLEELRLKMPKLLHRAPHVIFVSLFFYSGVSAVHIYTRLASVTITADQSASLVVAVPPQVADGPLPAAGSLRGAAAGATTAAIYREVSVAPSAAAAPAAALRPAPRLTAAPQPLSPPPSLRPAVEMLTVNAACGASFAVFEYLDLVGGDVGSARVTADPESCCSRCMATSACDSWTWLANPERTEFNCYLKGLHLQTRYTSAAGLPIGRPKRLHFGRIVSGVSQSAGGGGGALVGPNLLDALGVPRPTASRLFDPTGQRSLIASCTTVPSRLPQLHHAVQSICEQNMRPDKVVVAVPLESQSLRSLTSYAETMPSELRALREGGCPIVFIRGDDFGPATKLIPALLLAARDDDLIVTFDDDNWYSPELLSSLVSHEAAYPNAVLAHSGYTLKGSPWRHPNFAYVRGNDLRHNIPAPVHIIAGFLGVMYKRRFFGSSDDRSASAAAAKGAARPHASGVHDASAAAVRATRNLIDGLLPVRRPRP